MPLSAIPIQSIAVPDAELTEKVEKAIQTLYRHIAAGDVLVVACSFGKDSSAVLSLCLAALKRARDDGIPVQKLYVITSDTTQDNPVIALHVRHEQYKVQQFASKHQLIVDVRTTKPSLASRLLFRLLTGSKLPTYESSPYRDCAIDLKVEPNERELQIIAKEVQESSLPGKPAPRIITVLGTRLSESKARHKKMRARQERADRPNLQGVLSIIRDWDYDDVIGYLAHAGSPSQYYFPSYKANFADTLELYQDAGGGECPAIMTDDQMPSSACGARFGCWDCCVSGKDRSAESMAARKNADGTLKYPFLQPLLDFRQYLIDIRFDWSKRNWIGRQIDEAGYVRIQPDNFSPETCSDLLHMLISIDKREYDRNAGKAMYFQVMPLDMVIAIDAYWSAQHWLPPHHALHLWEEVWRWNNLRDVPKVSPAPRSRLPAPRYLHVGRAPVIQGTSLYVPFPWVLIAEPCGIDGPNSAQAFEVMTGEDLYEFEDLHMSDLLYDDYSPDNPPSSSAFWTHVLLGSISFSNKGVADMAKRLDRCAYLASLNLTSGVDVKQLLERTISARAHAKVLAEKGIVSPEAKSMEARWLRDLRGKAANSGRAKTLLRALSATHWLIEMDMGVAEQFRLKPEPGKKGNRRVFSFPRKRYATPDRILEKYAEWHPVLINDRFIGKVKRRGIMKLDKSLDLKERQRSGADFTQEVVVTDRVQEILAVKAQLRAEGKKDTQKAIAEIVGISETEMSLRYRHLKTKKVKHGNK